MCVCVCYLYFTTQHDDVFNYYRTVLRTTRDEDDNNNDTTSNVQVR